MGGGKEWERAIGGVQVSVSEVGPRTRLLGRCLRRGVVFCDGGLGLGAEVELGAVDVVFRGWRKTVKVVLWCWSGL